MLFRPTLSQRIVKVVTHPATIGAAAALTAAYAYKKVQDRAKRQLAADIQAMTGVTIDVKAIETKAKMPKTTKSSKAPAAAETPEAAA